MKIVLLLSLSLIFNLTYSQKTFNNFIFIRDSLLNKSSGKYREICIYKPKGYSTKEKLPIVIATDGGQFMTQNYISIIDSLVEINRLPRMIFIGVFANDDLIEDKNYANFTYRNFEYVKKFCDRTEDPKYKSLYYNHESFFKKDLMDCLEAKGINTENKIFFGTSNGATFGITFSLRNPDFFNHAICLSMVGAEYKDILKTDKKYPKYYISYGSEEPPIFKEESNKLISFLNENKIENTGHVFKGGHNKEIWMIEFLRILKKI